MSAWGKNGSARSCEALLKRVEENDPKLTDLIVLPLKKFGSKEVLRLAKCLESRRNDSLRSISASGHAIDDCNALEALGRVLTRLESVAIGDSDMGDDGVCAMCRGVAATEKLSGDSSNALKSIDFSWKNMGEDGLTAILQVFAKLPSMQHMDLSRNEKIGPSFDFWETKSSLSLPTPIFPGLTHLDLSDCGLDSKSCTTLLKAMHPGGTEQDGGEREQGMTMKSDRCLVLKLNSNDLSDQEGAKEMMNLLARGSLVAELHMSKCQIGDEVLKQIVDECCCSLNSEARGGGDKESNRIFLQHLDLSYNNLTCISYLANQLYLSSDGVSNNDNHYLSVLRTLNLSGNPLGKNLMTAIGCNPQWISSLEELDLSHTSCEISGAVELIRHSNNQNSSLKKLNLFGNELGSEGFLELSTVLHGGHSSLEYLDLGGNGAKEDGVVALVEILKKSMGSAKANGGQCTKDMNKLRVLVVGGNGGGVRLENAVKEVQRVHPDLDIARDKSAKKNGTMPGGNNVFNSVPGTSWTA